MTNLIVCYCVVFRVSLGEISRGVFGLPIRARAQLSFVILLILVTWVNVQSNGRVECELFNYSKLTGLAGSGISCNVELLVKRNYTL
jgi:hypothetical protein